MQAVIESAPKLIDLLGDASRAHFAGVRAVLDAAGLEYRINPRLVRGMDYYNLTVFEWVTERLGAQGTVCGGGRYDPLIEQLGGKPAPAVGWALGLERLMLLLEEAGIEPPTRCRTRTRCCRPRRSRRRDERRRSIACGRRVGAHARRAAAA